MCSIGQLIKNRLNEKGFSQNKLSKDCKLSNTEVSKIITGKIKNPNWKSLCKIAKVLDFSPLQFLLVAGYITSEDIHPNSKIHGLKTLNNQEIEFIQELIDFFNEKKIKEDIKKEIK